MAGAFAKGEFFGSGATWCVWCVWVLAGNGGVFLGENSDRGKLTLKGGKGREKGKSGKGEKKEKRRKKKEKEGKEREKIVKKITK